MFQEISKVPCGVPKNDEASVTWHKNSLLVRTERHILIYDFENNLQCLDKKVSLKGTSATVCKDSPIAGMIPDKFLIQTVTNIDYTEMMLNPILWPHNKSLVQEMTMIADAKWSNSLYYNRQSVISVVNNIGNINILAMKGNGTWEYVLDMSIVIKNKYLTAVNELEIRTMDHLKNVASSLATNVAVWGPTYWNKCILVTVQKNGYILFWLMTSNDNGIEAEYLNDICEPLIGEVVSMIWIKISDSNFLLICSNILGQVFYFNCVLRQDSSIDMRDIGCLWQDKDKMIPKCLNHIIFGDKLVLLFNKNRHLVIQILDLSCSVKSQHILNINDFRICDITINKRSAFISTINFKFYEVRINVSDDSVNIIPLTIENGESLSTYNLCSMSFTNNGCILTVAGKDRKVSHRQKSPKTAEIIFFMNTNVSEVSLLLENPTKKLTNYWDCVELVRYKTRKSKVLPNIDYIKLHEESQLDIYKARLYLIFLTLLHVLENSLKNKDRFSLPEMTIESVKERIMLLQGKKVLDELHQIYKRKAQLSDFEAQSFAGTKEYMAYYSRKYDRNLIDLVNPKFWNLQIGDYKKTCQSCDEEYEGFFCKNGHFNMFCSITFTPIEGMDYLKCRNCKCTARVELKINIRTCVFCDLMLS